MKKIIKVTRRQLKEAEGVAFKYLDAENGVPSSNGNREIGATGKTDDSEYGEPVDSDKIAGVMTVQGWNRYIRQGNRVAPGNLMEDDADGDGVDDFYNHGELDTLGDGDDGNNLVKIPKGVDNKLDILIGVMSSLQPKQQAMVINKLVETMDLEGIPYSWAKELMVKIMSKNNIAGKKR